MKIELKRNLWNKIMGGVTLGLATLTRPLLVFFPVFICFWLFFKYRNLKQTMGIFFIYLLFFILTLTPWTVRNYIIHRTFVPLTTQAGALFWSSNNPWSKGHWVNIWREKSYPTYPNLSEVGNDRESFKRGLKFLQSQSLLENTKLIFLKIWWFLFPLSSSLSTYDLTFSFIFPFCLIGMWVRKSYNDILYYVMANFLLIVVIFYGSPRFRVSASPFIIAFGTFGLKYLYEKLNNKYFLV